MAVALDDEKVVFLYIKIQTFYKNTESTILVLLCTTFDILLSNTFFVWLSSNRFSYIWEDYINYDGPKNKIIFCFFGTP